MFRRWLIRSLFIALWVICITAWVGSYWRGAFFQCWRMALTDVFLLDGRLAIIRDDSLTPGEFGWKFVSPYTRSQAGFDWPQWDSHSTYHCVGFSWHRPSWGMYASVPLWFPTLLSGGVFWFVWRKSRVKGIGSGFPIEPIAKVT